MGFEGNRAGARVCIGRLPGALPVHPMQYCHLILVDMA